MENTTARGAAPRGIYPHQVYGPWLANAEIAVAHRKTEVAFNGSDHRSVGANPAWQNRVEMVDF
jgi:hypothetical protein